MYSWRRTYVLGQQCSVTGHSCMGIHHNEHVSGLYISIISISIRERHLQCKQYTHARCPSSVYRE